MTQEQARQPLCVASPTYTDFLEHEKAQFPLNSFLMYYIHARDAVASFIIDQVAQKLAKRWRENAELETAFFWCLAGMIETGNVEEADDLIKEFTPNDRRLLLALDLGVVLLTSLRITKPADKAIGQRINAYLQPKVADLAAQVLKEFRGMILELRQGKVQVLDAPGLEPPATRPKALPPPETRGSATET